ncbi:MULTISPECIES: hypothetical protein [Nitrosomonas]|uniref:Uncharacterized protein n=1 Tax=Nitrosomonas communis TaxID=44574 RepID=A0A5D3Y711_9PROT|nr:MULTISPECIES: hypothetical protein [Nitrosomonas]TYP74176.1 hypothetical protein BCL69_10906 [Nitrosomonas communis]UVS62566.1 hypothetical protein NX761_05445 [Nitrosomonas sp. PLL12]
MPLKIIEKLIEKYGPINAHKEQLLLLKERIIAYEDHLSECRIKSAASADVIRNLEYEIRYLKLENNVLQEKIERFHHANIEGFQCRYCGSVKLKRKGDKPHKVFSDLGIVDTFFICLDCGRESVLTINTLEKLY